MNKKYNIPIIIENEANAGAYAEQKYGAGKNLSNIIYVSVGVGIGVGMILGGELYKGKSGFSGEFGDRKSTRLNSSHVAISYAVFCLKKKKDVNYIYN